jgi:hypothetical protein
MNGFVIRIDTFYRHGTIPVITTKFVICLLNTVQEESVCIDGLKKSEIAKALEELVKKGESMPRKSTQ